MFGISARDFSWLWIFCQGVKNIHVVGGWMMKFRVDPAVADCTSRIFVLYSHGTSVRPNNVKTNRRTRSNNFHIFCNVGFHHASLSSGFMFSWSSAWENHFPWATRLERIQWKTGCSVILAKLKISSGKTPQYDPGLWVSVPRLGMVLTARTEDGIFFFRPIVLYCFFKRIHI